MKEINLIERLEYICEQIDQRKLTVEGIALMDNEANELFVRRWKPDYPRDIYSNAKSFTSAAVGMAIYEGLMSLSDKPCDYFPEYCDLDSNKKINFLELKHLLSMSSGFASEKLMYFDRKNGIGADNYVAYMLGELIKEIPVEKYSYSTGDAVLAGAMVEKATGCTLLKYLYLKFFSKVGMEYPIWETDLSNHCCGGSGLLLKLTDMMKLGVLYLNNGEMNRIRFFDETWVSESTTTRFVIQKNDDSWNWGYGYFWRIFPDHQTFRANGVLGQDTIVISKIGKVLGIQCTEGTDFNQIKGLVNSYIFKDLEIV